MHFVKEEVTGLEFIDEKEELRSGPGLVCVGNGELSSWSVFLGIVKELRIASGVRGVGNGELLRWLVDFVNDEMWPGRVGAGDELLFRWCGLLGLMDEKRMPFMNGLSSFLGTVELLRFWAGLVSFLNEEELRSAVLDEERRCSRFLGFVDGELMHWSGILIGNDWLLGRNNCSASLRGKDKESLLGVFVCSTWVLSVWSSGSALLRWFRRSSLCCSNKLDSTIDLNLL